MSWFDTYLHFILVKFILLRRKTASANHKVTNTAFESFPVINIIEKFERELLNLYLIKVLELWADCLSQETHHKFFIIALIMGIPVHNYGLLYLLLIYCLNK